MGGRGSVECVEGGDGRGGECVWWEEMEGEGVVRKEMGGDLGVSGLVLNLCRVFWLRVYSGLRPLVRYHVCQMWGVEGCGLSVMRVEPVMMRRNSSWYKL